MDSFNDCAAGESLRCMICLILGCCNFPLNVVGTYPRFLRYFSFLGGGGWTGSISLEDAAGALLSSLPGHMGPVLTSSLLRHSWPAHRGRTRRNHHAIDKSRSTACLVRRPPSHVLARSLRCLFTTRNFFRRTSHHCYGGSPAPPGSKGLSFLPGAQIVLLLLTESETVVARAGAPA